MDKGNTTTKAKDPHTRHFVYQFPSNGSIKRLTVPLDVPYTRDAREQALRLIKLHRMPFHLEDELSENLQQFATEASNECLDGRAEESLPNDSVFDKGTKLDSTIEQWAECFADNHIQFSSPSEGGSGGNTESASDAEFPDVYHKLIHSSALETLLQLEHTYAMAVADVSKGWDNAKTVLHDRHEAAISEAVGAVGTSKSDKDISSMARQHTLEREICDERWSKELSQLQESQRREYRDWVTTVHLDMETSRGKETKGPTFVLRNTRPPTSSDAGLYSPTEVSSPDIPALEESFTIHLGAQKKTMHNIRLLCGNPLDLCRHKRGLSGGGVFPNPERLQTAMSLYSDKLSALVLMVNNRVSALGGITEGFASVCRQSTDFHFPGIDSQLQEIKEHGRLAASQGRKEKATLLSPSIHTSESQLSNSESPSHSSENGQTRSSSTSQLSPNSSFSTSSPNQSAYLSPERTYPSSTSFGASGSYNNSYDGGSKVSWTVGGSESVDGKAQNVPPSDSVTLQAGDFYITRHSNLSQVHVVFHLVTDDSAVQHISLKARHPILQGLKNCLRTAARHDVHHVTIPLLLVHTMQPEMTINWCLKRAEMVFKCVKGFMLENTSWGEGDSRTIQFLIPKGISDDLFEEFCDMLPKVFRIASTRNLTSTRARAQSFK